MQDRSIGAATKRIHITGSKRSGTTLLQALMVSAFGIDGAVANERRLWRTPPENCRVVCTKFPNETDFATQMLALDPNLHVIFILRDPRDVVVSRNHLTLGAYMTTLRAWRDNLKFAKPYFGHPRFHFVDYRELTNDPDGVQDRLARAMPFLTKTRPFSRYIESTEEDGGKWLQSLHLRLRPVAPDSIGNWRSHLPRLKGQILLHGDISEELIALGYETDAQWLSLLDGVQEDLTPSGMVEFPNLKRHITRYWRNALGALVYLSRLYLGIEFSDTGETAEDRPPRAANENAAVRHHTTEPGVPKTGAA